MEYDSSPLDTKNIVDIIDGKLPVGYNQYFKGVFPIDIMYHHADVLNQPRSCVIVNMAPSSKIGLHWIVLFNGNEGAIDVYDPAGSAVYQTKYKNLWTTLFARGLMLDANISKFPFQFPNTNICGHLCVHYLCTRLLRGLSHRDYIIEHFTDPTTLALQSIQYVGWCS